VNADSIFEPLAWLDAHHRKHCDYYRYYAETAFADNPTTKEELPFVPVRAFKEFDLFSVPEDAIVKVMHSSGTTGAPSKIYLDNATAKAQTKSLALDFKKNIGKSRLPMLIVDNEKTVNSRSGYSARQAAINGFSMFAKKKCLALDEKNQIRVEPVLAFLEEHEDEPILVFGFTFLIYEFLLNIRNKNIASIDLGRATILHGGGWKRLADKSISNTALKALALQTVNCKKLVNYYGMIEQTGSIYFECEKGRLHAPETGDILTRSFRDLSVVEAGNPGIIQVFSTLQHSYPGHSILTEDIGLVLPGGECSCGNPRPSVEILGRLERAEVRGCSDAISG